MNVIRKRKRKSIWRQNQSYHFKEKQTYYCKNCKRGFTPNSLRPLTREEEELVLKFYYFPPSLGDQLHDPVNRYSLKELGKIFPRGKRALSELVRRLATHCEDGITLTKKERHKLGKFLVLDYTYVVTNKKEHYCWVAVDATTGKPIHYAITPAKDGETAEAFLRELKDIGYEPFIVVIDGDKAELYGVKKVFPNARIQFCTVHRMRANICKKLPTKRRGRTGRQISTQRIAARLDFISYVEKFIHSENPSKKHQILHEMRSREGTWAAADPEIIRQYKNLMTKRNFYLTKEELAGCPDNTNQCETMHSLLKQYLKRAKGFKNLDVAKIHLNGFWHTYRKSNVQLWLSRWFLATLLKVCRQKALPPPQTIPLAPPKPTPALPVLRLSASRLVPDRPSQYKNKDRIVIPVGAVNHVIAARHRKGRAKLAIGQSSLGDFC